MHNSESANPTPSPLGGERAGVRGAGAAGAARAPKLFIGLPIYKEVPVFFLQCLLALQKNKPCEIEIRCSQGDGIARARNQLTADFLASDCTHLLFIDGDLLFSAEHIARLLSHDEDVVGGMYPKKQEGPIEWVINTLQNVEASLSPLNEERRANGLERVRYIGTGFLMIKRCVFERMIKKYPELMFTADYGHRGTQHDFWSMGVYEYPDRHRRYLSEDWYFCQRWHDLGGDILADTRTILKHVGPAVFPLASQEPELIAAKPQEPLPPVKEPAPCLCSADHTENQLCPV